MWKITEGWKNMFVGWEFFHIEPVISKCDLIVMVALTTLHSNSPLGSVGVLGFEDNLLIKIKT